MKECLLRDIVYAERNFCRVVVQYRLSMNYRYMRQVVGNLIMSFVSNCRFLLSVGKLKKIIDFLYSIKNCINLLTGNHFFLSMFLRKKLVCQQLNAICFIKLIINDFSSLPRRQNDNFSISVAIINIVSTETFSLMKSLLQISRGSLRVDW